MIKQESAFINEIEPALRRNKKSKRTDWETVFWTVLVIGIIIVTILHFIVEPNLFVKKSEAAQIVPDDNSQFCVDLMDGKYIADAQVFKYCETLNK